MALQYSAAAAKLPQPSSAFESRQPRQVFDDPTCPDFRISIVRHSPKTKMMRGWALIRMAHHSSSMLYLQVLRLQLH